VFGWMGECVVSDQSGDVRELGLLGLEEFSPRRSVEEEIADGDGGSGGQTGILDAEDVASGDLDQGSGCFFRRAGFEGKAGDAGDRRQRLAAEAEGGDGKQVVGGAELAGGVTLEGEQGVVLDHAVAVVGDTDELAAPGLDLDADAGGPGVDRVFEQFLDD